MPAVRDWSIRTKLASGFGLVLTISLILGVVLLIEIARVNSGGNYIATNSLPSIQLIGQVATDEHAYRADQLWNVTNTTAAASKAAIDAIHASGAQIDKDFAAYASMTSNARDQSLYESLRSGWSKYVTATAALNGPNANTTNAAIVNLANSSAAQFNSFHTELAQWATLNEALSSARAAANKSTFHAALLIGLILLLVALIAGVTTATLIIRTIKRGTEQMMRAAEGISVGEVNQEITLESGDELGRAAAAFRRMIDYLKALASVMDQVAAGDLTHEPEVHSENDLLGNSLKKVVVDLRSVIGQVSTSASEVSSASQQLASSSEESGRAAGEIANAIDDIARGGERQAQMIELAKHATDGVGAAVSEAAASAGVAAEAANRTRNMAKDGVRAAEDANAAMRAVRESSQQTSEAIDELADKSAQVGQIVQTITAIAEQTNLLALNAAIEAARAGEQGRGFAVVAEEVRKLAEESQSAAQEIEELIQTIQTQTGRAVDVVTSGAKRTDEGVAVVERTRDTFTEIGSAVEDVTNRVDSIAAASQQISASVLSVQDSITEVAAVIEEQSASSEQVSASSEQTSASVQEMAASAQQLSANAESLNLIIAGFKV